MKKNSKRLSVAAFGSREFALATATGKFLPKSIPSGKGYTRNVKHKKGAYDG